MIHIKGKMSMNGDMKSGGMKSGVPMGDEEMADKDWQAECDARTIKDYAELKMDKDRMAAASAKLLKDVSIYQKAADLIK